MNKRELGAWGEAQASAYLLSEGYEILERNYRTRTGEIDIIAKEGRTIHFVEVKLRTNSGWGTPAEAVTRAKLRKIKRTALHYLSGRSLPASWCIDVVEVKVTKEKTVILHLENVT